MFMSTVLLIRTEVYYFNTRRPHVNKEAMQLVPHKRDCRENDHAAAAGIFTQGWTIPKTATEQQK